MTERPDPRAFGLARRSVTSPAGEAVLWHRPAVDPTDDRPPLVLLHGAAGSWTTWLDLLRAADKQGHDLGAVIAFDLPGFGASSTVLSSATTVDQMADAVELGVRAFGYPSARLVGHSMGGLLALHLAARPAGVAASGLSLSPSSAGVIAAIDSPRTAIFGGGLGALAWLRLAMRLLSPVDRMARAVARGLQRVGVVRVLAAPLFRHPLRAPRWAMDALADDLRPRSFTLAANALRGYSIDVWSSVICPVTVVAGDRDIFVAPDDLPLLKNVIPQLQITVLDDCGHFAHVERPAEVLALLR